MAKNKSRSSLGSNNKGKTGKHDTDNSQKRDTTPPKHKDPKTSPHKNTKIVTNDRTDSHVSTSRHSTSCWRLMALLSVLLVPLIAIWWKLWSNAGQTDVLFDRDLQVEVPLSQRKSLLRPFTLNYADSIRIREKNMKKYTYAYSHSGIDRRVNLSLEEFYDVYDGKWPVIVSDVVPTWNAANWTGDFFKEHYGKERVTMKAVDGGLEDAVSLALPLELFWKNTHTGAPNRWTYVEDELFIPMRPQLRKDLGQCVYLEEDYYQLFPAEVQPWNSMLLWGTAYSRSSLHIDPYNWTGTNAVMKGLKRWKLYPPGQDHLLSVENERRSGFPLDCFKYNSPIDAFAPDHDRYPLFKQARAIEFDQYPGEMLFIPTGWFHQAFNVEETIAVSSQVMNRNNVRVVLEEIIKADNVKRRHLPPNIDQLSPAKQTKAVMNLLPNSLLERGRAVTVDILNQIAHGFEGSRGMVPESLQENGKQ